MSWSNRLLQILTLHCDAASELASRELDERLPRLERAALWCHLLVCHSCRRFRRQIGLIRRGRSPPRPAPCRRRPGAGPLSRRLETASPARSARPAAMMTDSRRPEGFEPQVGTASRRSGISPEKPLRFRPP